MLNSDDKFLGGATVAAHAVEGHDFHSDWWRWEQRPRARVIRTPQDVTLSPEFKIRWMVTEPIAALTEAPDGKVLTDIEDGRFHYDKDQAIPEPLTPRESNVQPAP